MEEQTLTDAPHDQADELLEETWSGRDRPMRGRELRVELAVSVVFVAALGVLIAFAPPEAPPHLAAAALVVAYALAARIEFPIGAGIVVPTELFLVPMFVVAPAQLVPGMVFIGLVLGCVASAASGRGRMDRLVCCAGDSLHALGPALVLLVFADGDLFGAGLAVLALAFVAQLAFDFVSSSVHDMLVFRVRASVHLRVLGQVWAVDAALVPFGLITAEVATHNPWAAIAPLPFLWLLLVMAGDRRRRVVKAYDRLRALEHERRRLREAIQRVGEAFASNLDLDALLEIVTRAAMEALDGEAARATFPEEGRPAINVGVQESPDVQSALTGAAMADSHASRAGGMHAVTGRVGAEHEPIALVTVVRRRAFSSDELETLDYLCKQATVSAANAIRHELLEEGEARLRQQAYRDPLTGLANRASFAQCLDDAEARSADGERQAAILFIDLDGFKTVNDTLGHDAGDEMLVTVAERIRSLLRDGDVAARIGGDEFAVLLEDLNEVDQAHAVAERLVRTLSAAVRVRESEFVVCASIGLAAVTPGVSHDQILQHADLAMYAAKREGGDRVAVYRPELLVRADAAAELARDLRGAPERGELELRFQPMIDLMDSSIPMVEALLRWRHPRRGLLAPVEFISLAEETGSIHELGRFVLDEACRTAATWPAADALGVSVNVSAAQFRDERFAAEVHGALSRHALAPGRLVLEVTESVLVEPDRQTLNNLHELRDSGVTLALDDFGTGYSALSYLAKFPVTVLKLDRSFLARLGESPSQIRLVTGIIGLGHSLGMTIVAEGIEQDSQLAQLRELGADFGQGYLLGIPETADAVAMRLAGASPASHRAELRLIS